MAPLRSFATFSFSPMGRGRRRPSATAAGTALARAVRECFPDHVRLGEVRSVCNDNGDCCQYIGDACDEILCWSSEILSLPP